MVFAVATTAGQCGLIDAYKETGQAANTIVMSNIIKQYSRLIPSAKKNAAWLINSDCIPELMQMSLAVGTGGSPAYLPAGGISESPYGTLMGRKVIEVEQCATVGTEGDCILAALNPGYILGMRGGLRTDLSIHLRFLYDESTLRVILRLDGQPLLSQPVTGYKSSDTYSHFVTIADRD